MPGSSLPRVAIALFLFVAFPLLASGCATTIPTVSANGAASGNGGLHAVAFAPLTGPPAPVADRLANSFASASAARELPLAPYRQRRSAYVVKGYMSVVSGEEGTTALYVWDVLSPDLQRLYRISGQATGPASDGDPWNALSQETLDAIAGSTLDQLANWMAGQQ